MFSNFGFFSRSHVTDAAADRNFGGSSEECFKNYATSVNHKVTSVASLSKCHEMRKLELQQKNVENLTAHAQSSQKFGKELLESIRKS